MIVTRWKFLAESFSKKYPFYLEEAIPFFANPLCYVCIFKPLQPDRKGMGCIVKSLEWGINNQC